MTFLGSFFKTPVILNMANYESKNNQIFGYIADHNMGKRSLKSYNYGHKITSC